MYFPNFPDDWVWQLVKGVLLIFGLGFVLGSAIIYGLLKLLG